MRETVYEDMDGRKFKVQIPDDAPDSHARLGIVIGPPDLSELDLPLAVEVRLNNQLFNRGLFRKGDIRRRREELAAALAATLRLDIQTLEGVYSD